MDSDRRSQRFESSRSENGNSLEYEKFNASTSPDVIDCFDEQHLSAKINIRLLQSRVGAGSSKQSQAEQKKQARNCVVLNNA